MLNAPSTHIFTQSTKWYCISVRNHTNREGASGGTRNVNRTGKVHRQKLGLTRPRLRPTHLLGLNAALLVNLVLILLRPVQPNKNGNVPVKTSKESAKRPS